VGWGVAVSSEVDEARQGLIVGANIGCRGGCRTLGFVCSADSLSRRVFGSGGMLGWVVPEFLL
jgi:hypothetical protein